MITTTIKHTIHVKFEELQRNLYKAFQCMLADHLNEDKEGLKNFETDIQSLSNAIHTIHGKGFRNLFQDGYTMMLLSGEDFDYVEKFFDDVQENKEELLVVITKEGKVVEEISHIDLCY